MILHLLAFNPIISMRFFIILLVLLLPIFVSAQRWALRPELCLTAAKAKFVSNTNPYLPFRSTYSNNVDIYINIDYYLKENHDRLTFTLGTHQNSFTMTGNETNGNGYLGFIAPEKFLSEGTSGSLYIGVSYAKSLKGGNMQNNLFILGGFQYYFVSNLGSGSAGGSFGDFVLYETEMKRQTNGNPGYHAGISWLIKNRIQREVLQLTFKYQGTFNTTQFTNDYFYSMITPTNPPEIIHDQVIRYRLTGAGIQLGASKTIKYFPSQRKMQKSKG